MTTASTPKRRRSRGNAWYWHQTDSWYYTPPGTKRRVRLKDETGRPVRGKDKRAEADLALSRVKASGDWRPEAESMDDSSGDAGLIASICSRYLEHQRHQAAVGAICDEYLAVLVRQLNDLCQYCGGLHVSELQKGHISHWIDNHPTWKSPVTRRSAMTSVLAAFSHAQQEFDISNPLVGLKKPPQRPRLASFDSEEEQILYSATDEPFRNFLFAAIHTGLRPFCELARLSAKDIVETDQGMMWRVYSSKTKKTRKIPVRSEVADMVRDFVPNDRKVADVAVFRNPQNRPWKKVTGVHRFVRVKQKIDWDSDPVRSKYSCYTCRHTFAHRMLAGYWNGGEGCSIEVLAELMGNTPNVAYTHYGREWGQRHQDPLWTAIGVE